MKDKFFVAWFAFVAILWLAIVTGSIIVAVHFLSKVW